MRQSKDERGKGSLGQEVDGKRKPSPGKKLEEQASQAKQKERQEREVKQLKACTARLEAQKKRDEEESAKKPELQIQVSNNQKLVQEEEYKYHQDLQKKRIAEKAKVKEAKETEKKAAIEKAEIEKKKKDEMLQREAEKKDAQVSSEKKEAEEENKMHGANIAGYESL